VPSSSIAAANKEVKQGSCTLRPTFLLARQNFSNGSRPNLAVDVVATNDGLYSVGAHQADYYDLVMLMLVLYLHASMDPADDCGCGYRWPACAHAQSMVTPMDPRKFSPRNLLFHRFAKIFSLENFPLYGNYT
jgi:hypothetical protein